MKLVKESTARPSAGIGYTPPRKRPIVHFLFKLRPRSISSRISSTNTYPFETTTPTTSPTSSKPTSSSCSQERCWMTLIQDSDDALVPHARLLVLIDSIRFAFFNEPEHVRIVHVKESLRRISVVDSLVGRDVSEGVLSILAEGPESLGLYLVWLEEHIGDERFEDGQWSSKAYEAEKITPIITLLPQALECNPNLRARESIEAIENYDPSVAVFVSLVCHNLTKGVITSRYAIETLFDLCEDLHTRVRMMYSDETQSRYRTHHYSFFWMLGPDDPIFPIPDSARVQLRYWGAEDRSAFECVAPMSNPSMLGRTQRDERGMSEADTIRAQWQATV